MFKRFSFSIANLWLFAGIIAFFIILIIAFTFDGRLLHKISPEGGPFDSELQDLSSYVKKHWKEGDLNKLYQKGQLVCEDLVDPEASVHPQYFECNPYFIHCYFSKDEHHQYKNFKYTGSFYDLKGRIVLNFDWLNRYEVNLKLKDTCHKIKLKSSLYSAGPIEGNIKLWDNLNRDVYIDKHYVTNGEIEIWKKVAQNSGPRHFPSLDLSIEEKKKYCNFKGGQLLRSAYFDAATILPAYSLNYVYKFPYAWTKANRIPVKDNEEMCDVIYSSECKQRPWVAYGTQSPTWSGIYQAQGSFPESFDNKYAPSLMFKVSSMSLEYSSYLHQLGIRYGEQRGVDPQNFYEYNGLALDENVYEKVDLERSAFRCMYYY